MSNHTDSTIEWYVTELKERNPEWTDEQCLEMATGFTMSQCSPAQLSDEISIDEVLSQAVADHRAERAAERKNRKYLSGKELMAILSVPKTATKIN